VQDVGSSSGTFVNGRRLSAIKLESTPFELFDGDLLQLGEDFDDNGGANDATSFIPFQGWNFKPK
jgi:pSer/pThr/pTyr-binding forkhead associated (FHA) protein